MTNLELVRVLDNAITDFRNGDDYHLFNELSKERKKELLELYVEEFDDITPWTDDISDVVFAASSILS